MSDRAFIEVHKAMLASDEDSSPMRVMHLSDVTDFNRRCGKSVPPKLPKKKSGEEPGARFERTWCFAVSFVNLSLLVLLFLCDLLC